MTSIENKSYRVHFWVISLLVVATTFWAVWDEVETRRPWKKYQRHFNALEYAKVDEEFKKAEMDLIENLSQSKSLGEDVKDLDELEVRIDEKMAEVRKGSEYRSTTNRLSESERKTRDVQQEILFTKSKAEEYFYRWKHALHHEEDSEEYRTKWAEANTIIAEKNPELETLKLETDTLKTRLKSLERDANELRRVKEEITSYRNALAERLAAIERRPLEVKQVVLPAYEKNKFGEPIARVDRCMTCHVAIDRDGYEDVPIPHATHPSMEDLLGIHPPERMGCTPCHRGQGSALSSSFQAHGLRYVENAGGDQSVRDKEYLEHWEEPIYEGAFIESSCETCHRTFEIAGAETRNTGRLLFSELGCHGCHLAEGYDEKAKIGPDLTRIASKVYQDWLFDWVKDPREYLPKTRMPYYRFTDEEVLAITTYLEKNSEEYSSSITYPGGGSADDGKKLVEKLGCLGCHSVEDHHAGGYMAPMGYDLVPDLTRVAEKAGSEWLFRWLEDPKAFRPTTKMPDLRLSDEAARDITSYLLTLGDPRPDRGLMAVTDDESMLERGHKLIYDHGCYGCHEIRGFEDATRIAPPLSEFGHKDPQTELYFGDAAIRDNFRLEFGGEIETWKNWTFNKLKDTWLYKDEITTALMPEFGLSDENAKALMVLLRSFTGDLAPEEYRRVLTEDEIRIEKGKDLVRSLNCIGCHVIYDKGGDIRKFYEDVALAPPRLTGEGDKVQADWLFGFLKKPVTLRPWVEVRMPSYDLSDENASTLVEYFKALSSQKLSFSFFDVDGVSAESRNEGERLYGIRGARDYSRSLKCGSCHPQGAELPEGNPADWGPDLILARERLEPDWIEEWLKNPQSLDAGTRMPNFFYDYDEWEGEVEVTELLDDPEGKILALRDYMMTLSE